jgi:hypothetical protein
MNGARRSIGFLLLAALASAAAVTVAAPGTPGTQSLVQKTGEVDGWRLDMQGVLVIRVRQGQEFAWYSVAPDKALDRDVQQMVLQMALASELSPEPLLLAITTKIERGLDGSSIESALPVISIGKP